MHISSAVKVLFLCPTSRDVRVSGTLEQISILVPELQLFSIAVASRAEN